jgi:hypothetical protein
VKIDRGRRRVHLVWITHTGVDDLASRR